MRVLIQRVSQANVTVAGEIISKIDKGMLILVGIEETDNDDDIDYLVKKCTQLRIFDDENGVINKSIQEIGGEILIISQFTLMASTKKGNRPSYIRAAKGDISQPLYEKFCSQIAKISCCIVRKGIFGANMEVALINNGPVTIGIDSNNKDY